MQVVDSWFPSIPKITNPWIHDQNLLLDRCLISLIWNIIIIFLLATLNIKYNIRIRKEGMEQHPNQRIIFNFSFSIYQLNCQIQTRILFKQDAKMQRWILKIFERKFSKIFRKKTSKDFQDTQTFQEDRKTYSSKKRIFFKILFSLKRHVEKNLILIKRKWDNCRFDRTPSMKRLDEPATDDAAHCLYVTLTFVNRHTFVSASSTSSTAKNF